MELQIEKQLMATSYKLQALIGGYLRLFAIDEKYMGLRIKYLK